MIYPNIEMIVCMASNRIIGKNEKMPWNKPNEYQHFLKKINGHHLIFGRKNYQINLNNNELIARSKSWCFFSKKINNINSYESLDSFFDNFQRDQKYMVLGGEKIYELFLPLTQILHLTILDDKFIGDCQFPNHEYLKWNILERKRDNFENWTYYQLEQI